MSSMAWRDQIGLTGVLAWAVYAPDWPFGLWWVIGWFGC